VHRFAGKAVIVHKQPNVDTGHCSAEAEAPSTSEQVDGNGAAHDRLLLSATISSAWRT
jgi:hypothetical protein